MHGTCISRQRITQVHLLAIHMAAKSWHGRPNEYTISHHSHKVENIYMGFIISSVRLWNSLPETLDQI